MKNLMSIQEFSKLSGIATSTLRYWDDIGLFSPIERDPINNYRYYAPDQIISVKFITVLSSLNVPLKTIIEVQKTRNPTKIINLIEQQQKLLDVEMHRLRECYSIMHTRQELIHFGLQLEKGFSVINGFKEDGKTPAADGFWMDETQICVLYKEEKSYILGPRTNWPEGQSFHQPFADFCKHAEELRINLNFPIGAYHSTIDEFYAAPGCPTHFFSMDPTGNRKCHAGDYLIGFARGYYGELDDIAEKMKTYAEDHSLKLYGPVHVMYIHDEVCVKDPAQYLAQVCIAVSK